MNEGERIIKRARDRIALVEAMGDQGYDGSKKDREDDYVLREVMEEHDLALNRWPPEMRTSAWKKEHFEDLLETILTLHPEWGHTEVWMEELWKRAGSPTECFMTPDGICHNHHCTLHKS